MARSEDISSFLRANRWLIVALIALGMAVYLSTRYVQQVLAVQASPRTTNSATTDVVVARTSLPAFSVITAGNVVVEQVPVADAPPGSFTRVTQVVGKWTNESVSPGIPLVNSTVFVPQSANILAALIHPGDMAVDLPLSANDVVDGLVQPGDTVSLFATVTERNSQQATEDFLNQIHVLEVNGSLTPAANPTVGQNLTLILALPPKDIAELLFMQQKGPIYAVLDAPHVKTPVPIPFTTAQWQSPVP
jgi:pilus assembly protein CpaB